MPSRKPVSDRIVKVKFGCDLPLELVERIDVYCRERGVYKNLATEAAWRRFLAEEEANGG